MSFSKNLFIFNNYKKNSVINLNNYKVFIIKKEKQYTTLKYSKTPQFDIAASGSASLFAGLLGFMIMEKNGFELIDSGDFYTVFMYIIFISLVVRLIYKTYFNNSKKFKFFSLKYMIEFFQTVILLLIKFFKNFIKTAKLVFKIKKI